MHAEDAALEMVERVRMTLVSLDTSWDAKNAQPGVLDGSGIVALCESAIKERQKCVHCVEGMLPRLLALMEAGYYLSGVRLSPGESFWTRETTTWVMNDIGFSESRTQVLLTQVDEWLKSGEI